MRRGAEAGGVGAVHTARIAARERNGPVHPHPVGEADAPAGYYEYLPPGYGDGTPRPLMIFLHGFGGNGDGSASQLDNLFDGGPPQLMHDGRWPADRPFVVLAPQHPAPPDDPAYASCEQGTHAASCVMKIQHELGHPAGRTLCATPAEVERFLTYALGHYKVDPERVYLTGLSCGAYAAYEYVAAYGPAKVAAVVAIAGDARPAWAAAQCRLGTVPIWAFHGDADDTVAPAGSTEPAANLAKCPVPPGRPVKLTTYPGVGHDAWTRTFDLSAGNDIYAWLLDITGP
ncbi:prolyl oligopeptidase family serine peptidase [Dactylosporangium cerinum]